MLVSVWANCCVLCIYPCVIGSRNSKESFNFTFGWNIIYEVHAISFQTFFIWAFEIGVDSWKFSMLFLYILWDDWPIFMISASNEQLQQQLEYTLQNQITMRKVCIVIQSLLSRDPNHHNQDELIKEKRKRKLKLPP